MSPIKALLAVPLVLVVSLANPAWADVIVVDESGGGDFINIQSAADAALDGDLLLVKPGEYSTLTIDNKTLSVVADDGGVARVRFGIVIQNLDATKRVSLIGMTALGPSGSQSPALLARDNQGAVRGLNCIFAGTWNSYDGNGTHGIVLKNSVQVVLAGCVLTGGTTFPPFLSVSYNGYGQAGGNGARSTDSTVAFYNCYLEGGIASSGDNTPGRGGHGVEIERGMVFASGTEIRGGNGSDNIDLLGGAGDGGDGLKTIDSGSVTLLNSPLVPGEPGAQVFCLCPDPIAGSEVSGPIVPSLIDLLDRQMDVSTPIKNGSLLTLDFIGEPGDLIFTIESLTPGYVYMPEFSGVQLVQNGKVRVFGMTDANGMKTKQFPLHVLAPGMASLELEMQSVFYSATSITPNFIFGTGSRVVVLHPGL